MQTTKNILIDRMRHEAIVHIDAAANWTNSTCRTPRRRRSGWRWRGPS